VSSASGQPEFALRPALAVLAAGATGFGVMAAELTAVRLLAPHFGDSAYVWTNVIGVIMAAMALGAMLGGRLSAKAAAGSWPFRLLLAAGVLLLLAPFVTSLLGTSLLPDDLPLDAAMPALIRGSLVATALVFAPPMLLLAAVSPLLIVLLTKGGSSIGRAAGDIAASGTIGSLIGTFAATHWLVPGFGCRIALAVAAGVLLIAAALVAPRQQRSVAGVGLLLGIAMLFAHGGPLRPTKDGVELLAERETAYQFLQVHRTNVDGEPERTTLVINEGLDSFHSLAIGNSAFTQGAYYDWHAVTPLLAGDGARPEGMRVLSIGDAAGTLRQIYAAVHPGVEVDAVDIDSETMALGDEFFTAPKAKGGRYAIDGRVFLQRSKQQWHAIHVDAYAHQVYVPAHLASQEFFEAAHERLHDGGVLACNVGALSLDDAVLQAVAATVGSVFQDVRVFMVPRSRNALLVARRGQALAPESMSLAKLPADKLRDNDRAIWHQMVTTCAKPGSWHQIKAKTPVLMDDQPLLDELLFASYVEQTDPRMAVICSGTRGTMDAELEAFGAQQAGEWQRVLDAVATSSQETALLRQYAGDARWYRRELHSAEIEYRAGLAAAPSDQLRAALNGRLKLAREELEPIEAAELAATRNGWLAGLMTLIGIALIACFRRI
jgi:spermidine synthase